ncbi:MAG: Dihydroorotase [Owenweeksia sp. TMED14]|nr:MAG: Dihydroorotase [Owenweeksia sp. TMED14]
MKLILPQVIITDPRSPHNGKKSDIMIENGQITAIASNIDKKNDFEILESARGRWISPGWVDIRARCGEPGKELRETYSTLSESASNGGYTHVAILPSTNPPRDSRPHIESLIQSTENLDVNFLPLGSITKDLKGDKLSEIYDMQLAGAVGFTDDQYNIKDPHILQLALQYTSDLQTNIQSFCHERSLSPRGQINEGDISAINGIPPISSLSETLRIKRDISIHEYSGGELHLAGISTLEGVNLIREAKKNQKGLTADVAIANLIGTEDNVKYFDATYKTLPPLRLKSDREALWKGILDGTIDMIASDHNPMDIESKELEFGKAEFGVSTIEHTFAWYRGMNSSQEALQAWIEAVAHKPRELYNIGECILKVGCPADLTIFANDGSVIKKRTKGINIPNWPQNGRAIATILNNKIILL